MESYPDPSAPLRHPSYPYFSDLIAIPGPNNNTNFGSLQQLAVRSQQQQFPPYQGSSPRSFASNFDNKSGLAGIFDDVAAAHTIMPPPPKKRRRRQEHQNLVEDQENSNPAKNKKRKLVITPSTTTRTPNCYVRQPDRPQELDGRRGDAAGHGRGYDLLRRRTESEGTESKSRRFPMIGIFKPPPAPTRSPLKPSSRTSIKNTKNIPNATFTITKNPKTNIAYPRHKNPVEQVKNTVLYKENRQGRLVIQRYENQRTGSVVAVPDKQDARVVSKIDRGRGYQIQAQGPQSTQGASASSSRAQNPRGPSQASRGLSDQVQASHVSQDQEQNDYHELRRGDTYGRDYLQELYQAFERDLGDHDFQRAITERHGTYHLPQFINAQELNMQEVGGDEYDLPGLLPAPTAPIKDTIQQQIAPEPESRSHHVALKDVIIRGEDYGLAQRNRYDLSIPNPAIHLEQPYSDARDPDITPASNGHGVQEFVDLLNQEYRGASQQTSTSMSSRCFEDVFLAEGDETAIIGISCASATPTGAFAASAEASGDGPGAEQFTTNWTHASSPVLREGGEDHQNPWAFEPGDEVEMGRGKSGSGYSEA